jgi:hypothetical protein
LNREQTVHLEGNITIHTEYKTLCVSHCDGNVQIIDKDTGEIVYQYEAPYSRCATSNYIRQLVSQQDGD